MTVAIAAPASGSATHTLAFWAQDKAGNVEAHNEITLTVKTDTAPPGTGA